jgi:hypothetical protein
MSQSTAEIDLVRQIALPSRLGETLGQQIWGHQWTPFPFILEAEREIVQACLSEDTQDWFILNCPNQVGKTSWATLLIFWYIGMFRQAGHLHLLLGRLLDRIRAPRQGSVQDPRQATVRPRG